MKISQNWLRNYIDIDLTDNQLTDILTATGLEVEGYEKFNSVKGGLANLVVGEILTTAKHENADKLSVCEVNIGAQENLQIVCGAPNVAAGQKVIIAPVNATIFPLEGEPFKIKKAKIRGVESFGMICAEDEIGLGTSHDGIMVLPAETKVGAAVKDLFEVYEDSIIEIGLTPNRSDANSHIGTARDIAAGISIVYNTETNVKWPAVDAFKPSSDKVEIKITIENATVCPIYTGVVIKDLKIGPSPNWLKNSLEAIGVKSINNVVDVTNYINHELGQPLHAFDLREIDGNEIIVKNLPENTPFTTLDSVERKLSTNDLMICNANKPMCIAGVYGGMDSGIKDDTTAIFLESAYFDPSSIRITELRHNLKTDAAAKFEKGIDPTIQVYAAKRAALLLQEVADGKIASDVMVVDANTFKPAAITLTNKYLKTLAGMTIEPVIVESILTKLDFTIISKTDDAYNLEAPLYRSDVTRPADVVEEILRIYGFNNIPVSGKANFALTTGVLEIDVLRNSISDQLAAQGFFEIMSNSITKSAYYDNESLVKPLNSLNAHLDVMRQSMLYGGLEAIVHNQNRGNKNIRFFEFGRIYEPGENEFKELNKLAIFISGAKQDEFWKSKPEATDFQIASGIVESILKKSKLQNIKKNSNENESELAYGITYSAQKKNMATLGKVRKGILDKMGIKSDVFYAVVNVDAVIDATANKNIKFKSIPKFPSVRRDLSLIIDKSVEYASIEKAIQKTNIANLIGSNLFDVFADDEKVGIDKKAYSVSFTFQDTKQTLTDELVESYMQKLMQSLQKECNAEIRM